MVLLSPSKKNNNFEWLCPYFHSQDIQMSFCADPFLYWWNHCSSTENLELTLWAHLTTTALKAHLTFTIKHNLRFLFYFSDHHHQKWCYQRDFSDLARLKCTFICTEHTQQINWLVLLVFMLFQKYWADQCTWGTMLKFESWKVRNHIQNASHHHFYCFLKAVRILKSGCGLKIPLTSVTVCLLFCKWSMLIQIHLKLSRQSQQQLEQQMVSGMLTLAAIILCVTAGLRYGSILLRMCIQ